MVVNKFPFKVGRLGSRPSSDVLSSNDLYLQDDQPYNVSRNHFSINIVNGNVCVMDRGSTMGTIVNAKKIDGDMPPVPLDKQKNEIIAGTP